MGKTTVKNLLKERADDLKMTAGELHKTLIREGVDVTGPTVWGWLKSENSGVPAARFAQALADALKVKGGRTEVLEWIYQMGVERNPPVKDTNNHVHARRIGKNAV